MSVSIYGDVDKTLFWGVPQGDVVLSNPPAGRVRFRFRPQRFAQAFVRTARGVTQHYLHRRGGSWELGVAMRKNQRIG